MWRSFALPAFALVASLARPGLAQVHSDCNPMNETACPPNPAFGMDYTFHFNATPHRDAWETHAGAVEYHPDTGVSFAIHQQGDSPTIRSKFYFFGGRTEIHLRAAAGKGIISSMMWLSDTLDEVDWEFVGVNQTMALSNYFGKGEEIYTEGVNHVTPFNVFDDYHNYTTLWTRDRLEWWIDGERVRVLHRADALRDGYLYPQTPMRLYLGIWAGGDPRLPEGTREWAGGDTEYENGPYVMYIKKALVEDFSTGREYVYGDDSGSWESIDIVDGNSTVKEALLAPPSKSLSEKFNDLPEAARIGVYAGGGSVGALILFTLVFYIIRQRRRGAREAEAAARIAEEERLEMESYKKRGINPDSFAGQTGTEYKSNQAVGKDGSIRSESFDIPVAAAGPLGGAGFPEKGWGNGGYGSAPGTGLQSPRSPLMERNGEALQSPTFPHQSPYHDASPTRENFQSPLRTGSPGMPPRGPLPADPHRSVSTPPQSYGNMRLGSPAPSHPSRSFSANQGYGGDSQDHWNNGGHR
ncbi:extracellular cell wall glucanase Crf1 [Sodiomyces alkalinus F11]|uniref:chitinase n=1 Tax=Sodiomyces alkalinus (strain CBS 110278 / VKM F-3762 / F11) TaxID=1314773 RepID=A0A3N2Q2U4_SODAK|nr:extracellular cell wall glucanase Crf1 [Sodiomyces alkalinus F11]ROT41070.1 extracellular cell wall glucanase Crf1 [Sodiomyces alkalinus F11]